MASAAPPAMTTVRSPTPLSIAGRAEPLREPGDQSDRAAAPNVDEVVVVHLVAKPGVADLVHAQEPVETIRPAVGHHEAMERDGQPRLAKALHRLASLPARARQPE